MRARTLTFALAALTATVFASAGTAPLLVNFQGKLLDAGTNAPKNGSVSFQFRIYDAASGGNVLWGPESQSLTVTNGVFNAQLGSVVALTTDVFSGANAYLSVCAAPDTCPSGEMTPRQQLVASPYSITSQQLASVGGIRVNPGVSYSTFTAGADLQVDNGVNASTGVFTGTGNTVFSVVTSSGLQINAGTLDFNGVAIDAANSGVTASTMTLLATGSNQFSLYTSSGITMAFGTLDVNGAGIDANGTGIRASTMSTSATGNTQYSMYLSSGLFLSSGTIKLSGSGAAIDAAGYMITAATFTGSGVGLTGVTPQISDSSVTVTAALTANTEAIVISTNIALADVKRTILLLGSVDVVTNGTAGTCFTRLRVNLAGACATTSTPVIFAETFKVPATASGTHTISMPVLSQYGPASTANGSYCLTVTCTSTYTRSNGHLAIVAGAP